MHNPGTDEALSDQASLAWEPILHVHMQTLVGGPCVQDLMGNSEPDICQWRSQANPPASHLRSLFNSRMRGCGRQGPIRGLQLSLDHRVWNHLQRQASALQCSKVLSASIASNPSTGGSQMCHIESSARQSRCQ